MARLSLAQQLAELSNAAPAPEIDPEAEGDETSRGAVAEGREHYVDLESAPLRKSAPSLDDPRYAGKATSRKALLTEDDEASENDAVGEDDGEDGDASDSSADEHDEVEEEEVSEEELEVRPTTASAAFEQDERAMVKQLKQAASADVQKGRDVKKQLAFWDTLLEGRIRVQKVLSTVSGLPPPAAMDAYRAENSHQVDSALHELAKLSSALFNLREDLLRANSNVEPPARKRQRTDAFDLDTALADIKTMNEASTPHIKSTISKWSDKVAAASSANRFVDRNTWSQIEATLQADGDRLLARTRKSRTLGAAEGLEDPEVFDDGDFYQQLLKDVVESRALDLDDGTLAGLRAAGTDRAKRKKVVDTKASKGRKLRYHVHEKLVHFMAPQPQPGATPWHAEQTAELMASLLGKGFAQPAVDEDIALAPKLGGGSLRIFG